MRGMTETKNTPAASPLAEPQPPAGPAVAPSPAPKAGKPMPKEIGGPSGPEPTRYGDWERKGRVSDF
jgi:hypothetical protein